MPTDCHDVGCYPRQLTPQFGIPALEDENTGIPDTIMVRNYSVLIELWKSY